MGSKTGTTATVCSQPALNVTLCPVSAPQTATATLAMVDGPTCKASVTVN